MLEFMERTTVKFLRKKGATITAIADDLGRDRKTVRRAVEEPADRAYSREKAASVVDVFRKEIEAWIDDRIPVKRMLEMACADPAKPFTGRKSAFYARVRAIRKEHEQAKAEAFARFEGLPGEYLQVDWGEVMIAFEGKVPEKRYFLCCRLKFSRFMYVEFHDDMVEETLLRGLLRCFERLGGVPWQLVFDNMKTVTIGRDERNRPIFNDTFKRFATELDFAPDVCAPRSGNQKGSVENLVKYVKTSFLAGRRFRNDEDLTAECEAWLARVNAEPSQAHGRIPAEVLAEHERKKFCPIPECAKDYGLLRLLTVTNESVVHLDTNRYSVPVGHRGATLVARVHRDRLRIYDKEKLLADHPRARGKLERVIDPKHLEPIFEVKPRARVMIYRDELEKLKGPLPDFLSEICRKRRAQFGPEILMLYRLRERHGTADFVAAVGLALDGRAFAAEYVEAILEVPAGRRTIPAIPVAGVPEQAAVDRNLASYERFVRRGGCS